MDHKLEVYTCQLAWIAERDWVYKLEAGQLHVAPVYMGDTVPLPHQDEWRPVSTCAADMRPALEEVVRQLGGDVASVTSAITFT